MELKVYVTYMFTEKQFQQMFNALQNCSIAMSPGEVISKIYAELRTKDPQIPLADTLKPHLFGAWYILGLPTVKTVRDAYKFYLRSLERQK